MSYIYGQFAEGPTCIFQGESADRLGPSTPPFYLATLVSAIALSIVGDVVVVPRSIGLNLYSWRYQ